MARRKSKKQRQIRSVPKNMKMLVITISYYKEPDGSHVSISPMGKIMREVFLEGEEAWTNIKGAIHTLIGEMGSIGPGRTVTIRSVP